MDIVLPVIPADGIIDAALTIAVLLIAFIGWIMQIVGQAKGQKPAGQPNRPRPAGPRGPAARPAGPRGDDRLRSEIDSFLREVAGKPQPARRADDEDEEVALEIIPDEPPVSERRRVGDRHRREPATSVSTVAAPPSGDRSIGNRSEWDREHQRRRDKLISRLPSRHLDSTLGQELRAHVEQFAAESDALLREKEQAERSLADARAEIRSMKAQIAVSPAAAPLVGPGAGSRFAQLLKNRKSVKDAIVINEVLSRPRGLRRGT